MSTTNTIAAKLGHATLAVALAFGTLAPMATPAAAQHKNWQKRDYNPAPRTSAPKVIRKCVNGEDRIGRLWENCFLTTQVRPYGMAPDGGQCSYRTDANGTVWRACLESRRLVRDSHPNRRGHGDSSRTVTRSDRNADAALIAGIAGLVIGGIIASQGSGQTAQSPVVRQQPLPRDAYPAAPAPARDPYVVSAPGGGSYEPWTAGWRSWCSARYRSFNADTGTYRGYDGRDHFCVVK